MPSLDLRELVKEVATLTGQVDARGKHHNLDEGLSNDLNYHASGSPPIFAPGAGRGFYRLRKSMVAPVPGLVKEQWREAHVRLLSTRHFTHRVTGELFSLPNDVESTDELQQRVRSVLLASVLRDKDEAFDGETFSTPRLGAVAVLSVLPNDSNPKVSDDAWLDVEWVNSTAEMLDALERMAGPNLTAPTKHRNVDVLVAQELWVQEEHVVHDIERLASLTGVSARVHRLTDGEVSNIKGRLKTSSPSRLFVFGDNVDASLIAAFTDRQGPENLYNPPVSNAHQVRQWMRDQLPHFMGIGPALMRHPEPLVVPGRPVMPVAVPSRCAHFGTNKYVLDATTNLWWTRDFARHGDCIFKTYTLQKGKLTWESDRNGAGETIPKHKSETLSTITFAAMNSCDHPERHLT